VALDEIYKEVILDHYKNPRNKREIPGAELTCSKNNPLCGDEITVFAHVEDGSVREVSFLGQGCSISQSSASMMTEAVAGKPIAEVDALATDVRAMLAGDREPDEDAFGELVALKGVVRYPVRVKCAVLAWDVLQEALAGEGAAAASSPH
jgi:nitrogen fixation NifU-like protein